MNNWIKITDRLPEERPFRFEFVLIAKKNKVVMECFYNTKVKKFITFDYKEVKGEVTHWQPLPEAPK